MNASNCKYSSMCSATKKMRTHHMSSQWWIGKKMIRRAYNLHIHPIIILVYYDCKHICFEWICSFCVSTYAYQPLHTTQSTITQDCFIAWWWVNQSASWKCFYIYSKWIEITVLEILLDCVYAFIYRLPQHSNFYVQIISHIRLVL